jgi:DNA invertase Pin-like site-specific DNA recombinase
MFESPVKKAAQYLRMSTDHQDLSPDMQKAAIQLYAAAHELEIVETYFDAGKSGLTLCKRSAMKRLLHDVTCTTCPYSTILVYDVSRWGRFQDTDASAYYEYHCRLHGVEVHYVQEPFSNADSPLVAMFKGMKRLMAAEFSRELSLKVRAGQAAAVKAGFQMGKLPCLGFSRIAVSKADGTERQLGLADHKAAQREHVRWTLGAHSEVDLVRQIFLEYAYTDISVIDLANDLRARSICARDGSVITPAVLKAFLRSEVVIGNFVWGRRGSNRKFRHEGDEQLRRHQRFVEPIITEDVFDAVQRKLYRRRHVVGYTRETLLDRLSAALLVNPRMKAVDLQSNGCPGYTTYWRNFGSIRAAWAAAGFQYDPDRELTHRKKGALLHQGTQICSMVQSALVGAGVNCKYHTKVKRTGQLLVIDGDTILRVQVIRQHKRHEANRWLLRKVYRGAAFDWALVVRLNDDGSPVDSLLLRREEYFAHPMWFPDVLTGRWDVHTSVSSVIHLFEKRPLPVIM